MADKLTVEQRSKNMARIRSRDTKPELRLRSALFARGLRFRVCRRDLPGQPDIVFPKERLAVQVRGCFWHQHEGCRHSRIPESNREYWGPKLDRTVVRDSKNDLTLRERGWELHVIWECDISKSDGLHRISDFLAERVRRLRLPSLSRPS